LPKISRPRIRAFEYGLAKAVDQFVRSVLGERAAGAKLLSLRRRLLALAVSQRDSRLHAAASSPLPRHIVEKRPEPALDLGQRHAFAPCIVLDLVAFDLGDAEITAFGMRPPLALPYAFGPVSGV
jgi:hypothetical protein